MHQEVQELLDVFERWNNDNPTGFSLVEWDDFIVGYLASKCHMIADILEYVRSDEYEELMHQWEVELNDPEEEIGFSEN